MDGLVRGQAELLCLRSVVPKGRFAIKGALLQDTWTTDCRRQEWRERGDIRDTASTGKVKPTNKCNIALDL